MRDMKCVPMNSVAKSVIIVITAFLFHPEKVRLDIALYLPSNFYTSPTKKKRKDANDHLSGF